MPEVLEVELTRRWAAPLVGRTIVLVERTDALVVAEGVDVEVVGAMIVDLDRRGKLLIVRTDGPVVGVHFGMTGRLLHQGPAAIERLAYGAARDNEAWERWVLRLDDGTRLRLHDPRRLARVRLDPDPDRLGPDALGLRRVDLREALAGRRAPLKAVLLDQQRIAGLGNLLVDEVLWWAGIDPRRPARSLDDIELADLHRAIRRRLPIMMGRGGSHTGTLSPALRAIGGPCVRDGAELARASVGGRTTIWCPQHQQ